MKRIRTSSSPLAASTDPRWAAVLARDPKADGRFYFAVKTTGIYCRPSCTSRQPRPENVVFFDQPAAAERAGFRACKRCRPDGASLADQHAALVIAACRQIEQSEQVPSLDQLAKQAALSTFHFHRLFKASTGLTPRAYAAAHRAGRMRQELRRADSVTDAIYEAGFNSSGRFYEQADALLGMTPRSYRAGGAQIDIRFAVGECSLGSILVAESDRGICAILLGDDPHALTRDLQDRFAQANLIGSDANFERRVAHVIGFIEAPALGLDLPLDVRGTAFQQRVWRALREVPAGTTISYSELAQRIGAPNSTRAIAQACASNLLAVAIPCHRVIRTDGALSGYRWGIERKRALLQREARVA
jgi:AraC family transcriptional regulator of adaptative response/methylated-DNA-[protein]-cysteine methyltransferase